MFWSLPIFDSGLKIQTKTFLAETKCIHFHFAAVSEFWVFVSLLGELK